MHPRDSKQSTSVLLWKAETLDLAHQLSPAMQWLLDLAGYPGHKKEVNTRREGHTAGVDNYTM